MKLISTTKMLAAVVVAVLACSGGEAAIVDLQSNGIGYMQPGIIPVSGMNSDYLANMVSTFNSLANGASQTIGRETYTKYQGSATPGVLPWVPTPLLPEVTVAHDPVTGTGPTSYTIDIAAPGYYYLIAHWGGRNSAEAVYYIGGLTSFTLVNDAIPGVLANQNGQPYGLSGYWLSTVDPPPSRPAPVPEPATVIAGTLLVVPLGLSLVRSWRKRS